MGGIKSHLIYYLLKYNNKRRKKNEGRNIREVKKMRGGKKK